MADKLLKYSKFWAIAKAVAGMSKDPTTKVGAIAIDSNMNIICTGYNGFPRGVKDLDSRLSDRNMKLKFTSHAEQNLVAQAAYMGQSLRGSTVLVTKLHPCSNCAKSLIQAGVSTVISPPPDENERWTEEAELAKILFYESSVEVIYEKDKAST